jgi:hypothetical protein
MKSRFIEKCIVASFVAVLILSGQVSAFLDDPNDRFFLQWQIIDGIALLAGVVLMATVAVTISMLLSTLKWDAGRKLYNHLFLVALASGILPNIPIMRLGSNWLFLAWLIVAVLIGYSFGSSQARIVSYMKTFCVIFSPLIVIVFWRIFTLETWGTGRESQAAFEELTRLPVVNGAERVSSRSTPVFFFIFDAWSYARSTKDNEYLPFFKNLRSLASQSFVFHEGRSPSISTAKSLPAILYQSKTVAFVSFRNPKRTADPFLSRGVASPSDDGLISLFQLAKNHGYRTSLIGFHFPYRKIFGDQLDYCFSETHFPKGDNFLEKVGLGLSRNLLHLTDPISRPVYFRLHPYVYCNHWYQLNKEVAREASWLIEKCPTNTFAFFHWPHPHGPMVFNEDGSFFGYHDGDSGDQPLPTGPSQPSSYVRHLKYLDALIGRLTQQLRRSGKFDDALIVMTSDHGWRDPGKQKHVPLIIKLPGQTAPQVIETRFGNYQIKPILEMAFRGNINETRVLDLIRSTAESEADGTVPTTHAGTGAFTDGAF